ncbi:uncharacterized protein LOC131632955 [Vicia villosa]|uniref:uncharacterized protein LOC131632955 n=1 Tax=Vicia villosa TaxID=3911 RepID=UPI00273ABC32|nr:uncharacterized protein LOC131632955 [Vicia villosa]
MLEFIGFIEEMEVVDLQTIGGKFTWFNSIGKAMSRIDRFLLSKDFIEDWKLEGQIIGERDISDHASIWLKDNRKNWGPKPFKFNNSWFNHEDFSSFVKKEWATISKKGRGDFCLVEKLKVLKERISSWNKEVYGWIDLNIEKVGEEMQLLDNLFVYFAGNVPEEVVLKRSKAMTDFWDNPNKKESILRLKSRQLWLFEGDGNTRFFHNYMRERRRINSLCSIGSNKGILEEFSDVKDFIYAHFKYLFKEEVGCRPELNGISLNSLLPNESMEMERPFSEEEVKEAIWSFDGTKVQAQTVSLLSSSRDFGLF